MGNPDQTVLILFFILVGLILALLIMYKKLNREADGKYTVRRMVYKKGGLRDRASGIAVTLGTRLGLQLQPHNDDEGEEMDEIEDGERRWRVERSGSQGSDTEGEEEEEEAEGDSMYQSGNTKENGSNKSSLEGSESGEQEKQTDELEVKDEMEEKKEEKQEKVEEEQGKVEASGGTGLLIDLKQFSGSAIWSEEGGGEGKGGDITAL